MEINYSWKKKEPEDSEKKKVLYKRVSAEASDEAQAKLKLEHKAKEELSAADQQCRKMHEDVAGCMASKFHASRSVLQTLGFKARKDLEEAVVESCRSQEGVCSNAELSEVSCTEKVVAEEEGGEAKEEKAK